jgi:adenylate cyclase
MRLFQLSPANKRIIKKIIPFGIIFFIFGVLWSLIERGLLANLDYYPADPRMPYEFSNNLITISFGSLILGWIFGSMENLFLNKLFFRRSFGIKILIKTSIYIIILCIFLISLTIILLIIALTQQK